MAYKDSQLLNFAVPVERLSAFKNPTAAKAQEMAVSAGGIDANRVAGQWIEVLETPDSSFFFKRLDSTQTTVEGWLRMTGKDSKFVFMTYQKFNCTNRLFANAQIDVYNGEKLVRSVAFPERYRPVVAGKGIETIYERVCGH